VTERQKINALAELMGWKPRVVALTLAVFDAPDGKGYYWPGNWNPLEFIADAWMIVGRMKEMGWYLRLETDINLAQFIRKDNTAIKRAILADTACLAICEAALQAVSL
jgi:hypothetical protein